MKNENKNANIGLSPIILKSAIIAVVIIIMIVVLFATASGNNTNNTVETEFNYRQNMNDMKTAAFGYYTTTYLPEEVGDKTTLTLESMLDQKLLIDFTENGEMCNLNNSYIEVTKTLDENYAMKVNLDCNENEDYIITTIEKENTCTIDCDLSDLNNNSNNNSTNNNNSSNNNTSTGTTITKEYYTWVYEFGCETCDEEEEPTPDPETPMYMHYRIVEETTYEYCEIQTKTYYTTSYLNSDYNYGYEYDYVITLTDLDHIDEDLIRLKSDSYFSTSTTDYKAYMNTRDEDIEMVDPSLENNVYDFDIYEFRDTSLKSSNFDYNVSEVYYRYGDHRINIDIEYENDRNVDEYYARNIGYSIYHAPIKFVIEYAEDNDCVRDSVENEDKYDNHFMINKDTDKKYEYITTENKKEEGYYFLKEVK